ncbi:hypothetical protein AGDE_01134 [Angomonas deanei]|nr:hypothetical protein AGDE_01134 [Angomonas deanei]|eukprot:EPY42789.1 hypothetical protein AGDE_01134 [Angomonas deanei]
MALAPSQGGGCPTHCSGGSRREIKHEHNGANHGEIRHRQEFLDLELLINGHLVQLVLKNGQLLIPLFPTTIRAPVNGVTVLANLPVRPLAQSILLERLVKSIQPFRVDAPDSAFSNKTRHSKLAHTNKGGGKKGGEINFETMVEWTSNINTAELLFFFFWWFVVTVGRFPASASAAWISNVCRTGRQGRVLCRHGT